MLVNQDWVSVKDWVVLSFSGYRKGLKKTDKYEKMTYPINNPCRMNILKQKRTRNPLNFSIIISTQENYKPKANAHKFLK